MTVFTYEDETQLEHSMIKDLLAKGDELTLWERNFLKSCQIWTGNFTERQARIIVRTHAKYFPLQYKEVPQKYS